MNKLTPVDRVASDLEYIISHPEEGSGSTDKDVIKRLATDRTHTHDVLIEMLEGMKKPTQISCDENGLCTRTDMYIPNQDDEGNFNHNKTLDQARALISELFNGE